MARARDVAHIAVAFLLVVTMAAAASGCGVVIGLWEIALSDEGGVTHGTCGNDGCQYRDPYGHGWDESPDSESGTNVPLDAGHATGGK
jgi:hypothetical protein